MKTLFISILYLTVMASAWAEPGEKPKTTRSPPVLDVSQTVVKAPIAKNISMDDAVEAMKLRANALNIKLVAELPLSKQIEAMGGKSRRIEIYQFCDAMIAKKMVETDLHFAAYLPCRITLVEDAKGQAWLVMMNLDMFIQSPKLDATLKQDAIAVRDSLLEIMRAGASGDW